MPSRRPEPLDRCPSTALRRITGILTDIDDTLTADGVIAPEALEALTRLQQAGVHVIAITGRPMGWSEPFARDWPVDAIVAENGAVALFNEAGRLYIEYAQDDATRAHNASRLARVAQRVLREVPGATLARDSAGRVTDIAVDHSEFAHLSSRQIVQVVELMRAEGMNATVSSIHVNGWFGTHDKLSGARWIVRRRLGAEVDAQLDRWAYVGDSTNDQLLFAHFPLSIGVANLMRFADELQVWPAYLTRRERGQGFAEFADALLVARSAAGCA
jgi:HAD superfamily hydrolase (TIGR01484 family)